MSGFLPCTVRGGERKGQAGSRAQGPGGKEERRLSVTLPRTLPVGEKIIGRVPGKAPAGGGGRPVLHGGQAKGTDDVAKKFSWNGQTLSGGGGRRNV